MYAVGGVNMLVELNRAVGAEFCSDRAGLNDRHLNIAVAQFQSKGVRQTFDGKFGGIVCPPIGHSRETQHRAILNNSSFRLLTHHRYDSAGEFVPPEYQCFELLPQGLCRQVLNRTCLSKSTVVEQTVKFTTGGLQHFQCVLYT